MAKTPLEILKERELPKLLSREEMLRILLSQEYGFMPPAPESISFDVQENLYQFNPSVYTNRMDDTMDLAHRFLELEADEPQILYIWGHAYEFDYRPDCWMRLEELFKLISHRDNIFYGTNKEVLL